MLMNKKILMIEDDIELVELVKNSLELSGLTVETSNSMNHAIEKINNENFSLILIDLNLPDGKGMDLLEKALSNDMNRHTPMIIMSANTDLSSKVDAFSFGAEDYITKPFHLLELRARIERRLAKQVEMDQLEAGPITLELHSQSVRLSGLKSAVTLTPREFKILHLLAKNPKQTFSREMILDKIWGKDIHVTTRTVDAHICYLRKKLDRYCHVIRSSAGEGYRFQA